MTASPRSLEEIAKMFDLNADQAMDFANRSFSHEIRTYLQGVRSGYKEAAEILRSTTLE